MIKKFLLILFALFAVWQFSGLIPQKVEPVYPKNIDKIAKDQIFFFDERWSIIPGSITGCLYFPNLYNEKGERIQTASGRIGKEFLEPDLVNKVSLPPNQQVTLKVEADCGIYYIEGMATLYKPMVFEKKYTVEDKTISNREELIQKISGVDLEVIKALFRQN